ncbi:GDNF family receptor alpha-2 [Trichomycterus rosablanca]|uniref:GDNF family receptor alpha-2 n=1 Tax=Trichomycterus rosablanca TaxID=2290929 RepID=UPI002F35CDF5
MPNFASWAPRQAGSTTDTNLEAGRLCVGGHSCGAQVAQSTIDRPVEGVTTAVPAREMVPWCVLPLRHLNPEKKRLAVEHLAEKVTSVFRVLTVRNVWFSSLLTDEVVVGLEDAGWTAPMDCLRASEMCNHNAQCSSRFRIMRQCLVGRDRGAMLENKECQVALEVLQESPLHHCHCKRGMKKELQCLQSYWTIHMSLNEGEELYETSPYEPVHFSDQFRLASIISAMDSASSKGTVCPDATPDSVTSCNPCLDAAKACNLNAACKRQRSAYVAACSRPAPLAPEPCGRKRCHRALRQFFERVQTELSYPLLFCSCRDKACAERRRQTIVPACSFEEKLKPNCLELRRTCRSDPLCRSRLADFHMNCQTSRHSITSCPNDNYHGCLVSYVGLIGSDVTPNYLDANHANITISPWCSCRGSGNQETECEAFLRDFRENACLRNAIQAFGYGADGGFLTYTESHTAAPPEKLNPHSTIITKPAIVTNDVKPVESVCVFSTCADLKEEKCSPSSTFECADENTLGSSMDGSLDSHQSDDGGHSSAYLTGVSTATVLLSAALAVQVV